MDEPITTGADASVRELVDLWLAPHERECLACFIDRAVDAFGCQGDLRFTGRYRDLVAPRARALERRLEASGGFCDCEVLMNALQPARHLWASPPRSVPQAGSAVDADGVDADDADARDLDAFDEDADWHDDRYDDESELEPPLIMPPCTGVRRGSTQPCSNWHSMQRSRSR